MRPFQLGLIAIVFAVAGCASGDADGPEGPIADPSRYRVDIEGLDALTFTERPLNDGTRDILANAFADLSNKLGHSERSRAGILKTREIRTMTAHIRDADVPIDSVRTRWVSLRTELFGDQPWFRHSLDEPDPSGWRPQPLPDAYTLRDLDFVIGRLERLVPRGRRQARNLGEPLVDPDYVRNEYPALAREWREWAKTWYAEIDDATRDLPDVPDKNIDVRYRYAYQHTQRALKALSDVPAGNGGWSSPFQREWEARFDEAEEQLAKAREWTGKVQAALQ